VVGRGGTAILAVDWFHGPDARATDHKKGADTGINACIDLSASSGRRAKSEALLRKQAQETAAEVSRN
jgi:hypothetical protein